MVKIHARERVMDSAENELMAWVDKHQLTFGELVMLFSQRLSSAAKYRIRYERHGTGDKPGGME